ALGTQRHRVEGAPADSQQGRAEDPWHRPARHPWNGEAKPMTTENPPERRDPDLCVVTCAVTGVLANRKQCPTLPYTPVEIAEEAKRAYDAGASAVHIHARNDDGSPTFSPAVFAKIKEEVQRRCPIILNFSTGTILEDVTEQCTYIR